ncbi:MAG: MFS transporter [Clostridia bacterium]|nr:MFS transporter [Clostridia bacterium]
MSNSPRFSAFSKKLLSLLGVKEGTDFKTMSAYNSGVLFSGGTLYMIGNYFSDYLNYTERLDLKKTGLVIMIAVIFDAITDPVMGIITDRTKSRHGRRRPYFIWGLIPAAVTYFMMWSSFGLSATGNQTKIMLYYIIVYSLFRGAYTVVCVPHTALFPEIAAEYSLRTQYNAVKTVFDAVGSYGGFIISMFFFGFVNTEKFTEASRTKFMLMGLVLSLAYTLPLISTYKGTHEPSSENMINEPLNVREILSQYTETFKNKAFRQYFALSVLNTMCTSFASNSHYHFIRMIARKPEIKNLLITASGIGEAAGFVPAYFMSIKNSKQLPAKVFMPLMAVSLLLSLTVGQNTGSAFLIIIEFLYGLSLAGMASVVSNIFPDVTDVDEVITGRRREGVISSFSTFVKKFVSAVMAALTNLILSAFGFDQKIEPELQPKRALFGIRFTYSVLPIMFIVLGILTACSYKMKEKEHQLICRAASEMRENGKASLTEDEIKTVESITGQPLEKMWLKN